MYLPDMDRNFNGGHVDVIDGPTPAAMLFTIDDSPSRWDALADMTLIARATFAVMVLGAIVLALV